MLAVACEPSVEGVQATPRACSRVVECHGLHAAAGLSRFGVRATVAASAIAPTYATDTDPESAKEMLAERGARFARSGAFNTILRTVLGILGGRRR